VSHTIASHPKNAPNIPVTISMVFGLMLPVIAAHWISKEKSIISL
jgi:hypothetical protein